MQTCMSQIPIPSVSLEQALTDIVETIAMEETALSNILKSEGDVIQKANNVTGNIDEFISVNESVNSIIKNVARLQILIQFKLEDTKKLLQEMDYYDIYDELEE